MIIVRLKGGLGNQMFQYAFYKSLKEKYSNVKIDVNFYNSNKVHNGYELSRIFNVTPEFAEIKEINKLAFIGSDIKSKIMRKIIGNKKTYYLERERELSYKPEVYLKEKSYFDGYWQNEKYFKNIEDSIRKDFTFKIKLDSQNLNILNDIKSSESVSLHIRRGDYINDSNANRIYGGICEIEYYQKALAMIAEKIINAKFFIFSNEIEWVKKNLKIKNGVYVNLNQGDDSYKDMQLMSNCKHNIIANSTFSWWAAWLNSYGNKIVIGPRVWFNDYDHINNIMPKEWIGL